MADWQTSKKTFEIENNIILSDDAIYKYDEKQQKEYLDKKPWTSNHQYFKRVEISAVALIKMVLHARSGGDIEIMGLMQGKIIDDRMIVMDAFALPVEGTETRVNAQAEGYEYMVQYMELIKRAGKMENVIGWYHSHPGYGCWLSGIDVNTQMLNQQFQEPFLAVVIDPKRTISAGKVDLGAFRTYPEGFDSQETNKSEYQTVPLEKIEDFGVHSKRYYQLEVSYFKSSYDEKYLQILWQKYWINTLSSSPLLSNYGYMTNQIRDLSRRLENIDHSAYKADIYFGKKHHKKASIDDESSMERIANEAKKLAVENLVGMLSQMVKTEIFHSCNHENQK